MDYNRKSPKYSQPLFWQKPKYFFTLKLKSWILLCVAASVPSGSWVHAEFSGTGKMGTMIWLCRCTPSWNYPGMYECDILISRWERERQNILKTGMRTTIFCTRPILFHSNHNTTENCTVQGSIATVNIQEEFLHESLLAWVTVQLHACKV
jgi:hypothetical protein